LDTHIYLPFLLLPSPLLLFYHSSSSQSNTLTPHKLSEGCLEWCSFICVVFGSGGWLFVFRAGVDVWCCVIIILYYYILHYYIILYSPLLLFHSPSPLLLFLSPILFPFQDSKYTCRYLHILIYILLLFPNIWPRTFYRSGWLRCVGLKCIGILFYVLTPHKLSEGCLEWCSFICVVFGSGLSLGLCFDPARSIGVDGWGV
jgi:hypothetical protein